MLSKSSELHSLALTFMGLALHEIFNAPLNMVTSSLGLISNVSKCCEHVGSSSRSDWSGKNNVG